MTPLLLDTHVWLWLVFAEPYIKLPVMDALELASAANLLFLSPISMWEVALKHSRGKLTLDRPVREWLIHAATLPGLNLAPITPSIAAECAELPSTFHGDPADRILAATARSEGLTLVTHDKALILLAKTRLFQSPRNMTGNRTRRNLVENQTAKTAPKRFSRRNSLN